MIASALRASATWIQGNSAGSVAGFACSLIDGDRATANGIGHKLIAVGFFSVNGDKQSPRFHVAAVIGNFRNFQIAVRAGRARLNASQQFREAHRRRALSPHLSYALRFRHCPPRIPPSQLTSLFPRAAAESSEASRANCTVILLPRRIDGSGLRRLLRCNARPDQNRSQSQFHAFFGHFAHRFSQELRRGNSVPFGKFHRRRRWRAVKR